MVSTVSINFEGKVAIITGAARGIGAAAARAFAEAGASVVVSDLLPEVEDVAMSLRDMGIKAESVITDLSDPENCRLLVDAAMSRFGRLDFAFNNAGIAGKPQTLTETSDEDWNHVIGVNLTSVFACVRSEIPAMLKSGGGVIINTSSICGVRAIAGLGPYAATKHGVIGLTRATALEYGGEGIRSIAIGPGYIETAMTDGDSGAFTDEQKTGFLHRIPQGRYGRPEDIARAVRMLCSDDACYVNGAYLQVDGGLLQT